MLPTELVDHILGFLHSDEDYNSLETCSAIFPQLVEPYLYSHITFYPYSPPTNLFNHGSYVVDPSKFSSTLIDRPHIASFVRHVRIFLNPRPFQLPVISSNLSILSHLESITIRLDQIFEWTMLDPRFRTALQNSIRLPSVKEVEISDAFHFPLDFLDNCQHLKRLRLFCQCVGGEAIFPLSLHSFGVQCQYDRMMMPRIVSWMRSSSLHSLSLRMGGHVGLVHFRALLEMCSATLVNLELDYRVVWEYSTHPIFPGIQLPLLERVNIRGIVNAPHSACLPPLASFFSSIPSARTIHLCLQLHFLFLPEKVLDLGWSDVAALFVLPVFHHPIELRFLVKFRGYDVLGSFLQNSDLKRLHESGKVVLREQSS